MRRARTALLVAGLLAALLVQAACHPSRERRAHIVVATSWNGAAAEALHRELLGIADRLGSVSIEMRTFSQAGLGDYLSRSQSPAARQPMDLIVVPNDWLGQLEELEVISELPAARVESLQQHLVPHALVAVTSRNSVLAYPISAELLALVYDPARFPSPPRTFDDLLAVEPGAGSLAFALDLSSPFQVAPFVSSYQGSLLDAEGNMAWSDEATRRALSRLAPLWSARGAWRAFSGQDLESLQLQLFAEGRLASFLAGPWLLEALELCGRPFAVIPIPAFADAPHPASALVGYQCVAVTRESTWADLALEVGARLLDADSNERLNRSTRQLSVLLGSFRTQRAMASQGTVGFLRALEQGQFFASASHLSERFQGTADLLQRLARRRVPPSPAEVAAVLSGGKA